MLALLRWNFFSPPAGKSSKFFFAIIQEFMWNGKRQAPSNEDIQDDELRRKFSLQLFWKGKIRETFLFWGSNRKSCLFCCWHFIATYNCVMIQVFIYFFSKDCIRRRVQGINVMLNLIQLDRFSHAFIKEWFVWFDLRLDTESRFWTEELWY